MTRSRLYSRYEESQDKNWLFWSFCMHFYFGLLCLLYLALTIASVIPRPNSPLAGSPAWFQSPVLDFQCLFFFFFAYSQIYQEPQTVSKGSVEGNWAKQVSCLMSAVLPLLCGGVYTATAKLLGWKFPKGSRIWGWTFLTFASATYGDSLSSFGLNYSLYFTEGAQLLNLNAKGFL